MDMNKSSVRIVLDLEFKTVITVPEITVCVDHCPVFNNHGQTMNAPVIIQQELAPGSHVLTLDFHNKCYEECLSGNDMAVIIQSVQFQYLPDDFKSYSWYRPNYPQPWAQQNPGQPDKIHSNYLGWNGRWGLEFETPIYAWIHKTLNLGWSL
jgi:hypothetical protein